MPVTIALCPNDIKYAVLSSLKENLKIYHEIFIKDKKNQIFCLEKYPNGQIRIVENPWYEGRTKIWSNTYDSEEEKGNPWTIFNYPIIYSTEFDDIA